MKPRYYFGRVPAKRIDFFAFPRTGSHFFNYSCEGLFDLVWFPTPGIDRPEVVERQRELDAGSLYALGLREDGVPYAPVHFDHVANGQHGRPLKGDSPVVLFIRDPIATVYSYYNAATTRWGMGERMGDPASWVSDKFQRFAAFYRHAFAVLADHPDQTLLLRFEDLVAGPEALGRLVDFVGVRPKLSPAFVHGATRFDTIVRPGARTFYRAGNNSAWRADAVWRSILDRIVLPNFSVFGYPAAHEASAPRE